jgi:hypothetical protein
VRFLHDAPKGFVSFPQLIRRRVINLVRVMIHLSAAIRAEQFFLFLA